MKKFKDSSLNKENVLHGKIRGLGKMRRGLLTPDLPGRQGRG